MACGGLTFGIQKARRTLIGWICLVGIACQARVAPAEPSPLGTLERLPAMPSPAWRTPTPDPPRAGGDPDRELYLVQAGDTLAALAQQFQTTVEAILTLNPGLDPQRLQIGQPLWIPVGVKAQGPALKLIPDSELVYGPAYRDFSTAEAIRRLGGYLSRYQEIIGGRARTGIEIVEEVARNHSVGPRVLLTLLEMQSGWVRGEPVDDQARLYPMGWKQPGSEGLYRQLNWAADRLNDGYYGFKGRHMGTIRFANGRRVRVADGLNAGTVAVQAFLAAVLPPEAWARAVGPSGFPAVYRALFGEPFRPGPAPSMSPEPAWQLPWGDGELWYFTGGPHGGWGNGAAWGALDFAPPDVEGCAISHYWVRAVADGVVVRTGEGLVVLDTDGDGREETGWVMVYLHIAAEGRVPPGTRVRVGDPLGHPSCEGGFADAAHVHLARRLNGEWVPIEPGRPFRLGGWEAHPSFALYEGTMVRGDEQKIACACKDELRNGIRAP
ncbi:LysM peptidoglycan-binding domain-containing protein [Thermoflexus sp.]|uniref:LysM peptidoglycan-binding domain-containing protein n=1 Tax=Thermoflexus sp. TaxID=1969742 RepID=UPI0035E43CDC